ncbi:MAG: hypothetical protein HY554_05650 [Elusimicrobia bacterium]|nr:hypothetical protein [Elusimicrobiota bacterium]
MRCPIRIAIAVWCGGGFSLAAASQPAVVLRPVSSADGVARAAALAAPSAGPATALAPAPELAAATVLGIGAPAPGGPVPAGSLAALRGINPALAPYGSAPAAPAAAFFDLSARRPASVPMHDAPIHCDPVTPHELGHNAELQPAALAPAAPGEGRPSVPAAAPRGETPAFPRARTTAEIAVAGAIGFWYGALGAWFGGAEPETAKVWLGAPILGAMLAGAFGDLAVAMGGAALAAAMGLVLMRAPAALTVAFGVAAVLAAVAAVRARRGAKGSSMNK